MKNAAFALLFAPVLALACCTLSYAEDDVAKEKAKPKDRYQVPDGDVAALVKFLDGLMSFRPKTTGEILAYRQKAQKAMESAADKIIKLEKDKSSKAYRKAVSVKLQLELPKVQTANEAGQRDFYERLVSHIAAAKELGQNDLALAFTTGQILEQGGNTELAQEAYTKFGRVFSKSEDETFAGYGRKMLGVSRRLGLPGKEMELEGTTVDGEEFNWKAYRGKVVLVDYWATWCGPCIAELPNVLENYEKYHEKGFEVVGISLDEDRERLARFISEKELPWTCLFQEGAGWNHPMAEFYGVMGIPAMMLVDRDGKVVSLRARGGELERQLVKLLGVKEEADSKESGGE